MKKQLIFLTILCLFCSSGTAFANNLQITNISLTDKDASGNTYDIEYDISWNNSWYKGNSSPDNYDAVWVFAKFSKYSGGAWSDWAHCTLSSTDGDHVAPAGSTLDVGTTGGAGKGIFIYRNSPGDGSNNWNNAQLRWEYGTDGVADNDNIKIKVFGIEMVFVPQSSFYVGDADNDQEGSFFTSDGSFVEDEVGLSPYLITSEGAITVGTTLGNLYYDADAGDTGDQGGPLPAAFPKGYDSFYMMKYEITQDQYVEFLNTLTGTQQAARVSAVTTGTFMDAAAPGAGTPQNRNGIVCKVAPIGSKAGVYAHDLDDDGIYNESTDGRWVACNWLSWMDGAAYADWAALRPFTELEFEKGARGPQLVVDDEYSWGSTDLTQAEGAVQNSGERNEVANTTGNGLVNYDGAGTDVSGPLRVGFAATGSTNRIQSGGSYYGAMDMSGNLWTLSVSVGNGTGRSFTGSHGDGVLTTTASYEGNATNTDWPGIDGTPARGITGATGGGFRGGTWSFSDSYLRVSDRYYAGLTLAVRDGDYGFRAARTAP